jgi:hypothetical protein
LGNGVDVEGKDVRVFVDTGANKNIMSSSQPIAFLDANVDFDYVEGPFGGLEVNLVRPCTSPVTKLGFRLKLPPPWAKVRGLEEFLILDNDAI